LAEVLGEQVRADGLSGRREDATLADFEAALADRLEFITQRGRAVRSELDEWGVAPPGTAED
jgi:hypothetical protein